MKKLFVVLVSGFLLVGLSNKVFSQYHLSVHLGPAVSSRSQDLGWNAGIQLSRSVSHKGWGLYAGLDATNDGQGSGFRDYHFSVSSGVTYTYLVSNNVGLFANTGLIWGDIHSSLNVGLKIGAGLLLFDKTSISLNYLGPLRNDNNNRIGIITLSVGYKFKF